MIYIYIYLFIVLIILFKSYFNTRDNLDLDNFMFFVELNTLSLNTNRIHFLIIIVNLILLILFNIITISGYVCYCQDDQNVQEFGYNSSESSESSQTVAVLTQEDVDKFWENLELIQSSLNGEEKDQFIRFKNLVDTYKRETEMSYQFCSNNLDERLENVLRPGITQQQTNDAMFDISRKLEHNNNILLTNYSYFKSNIIFPWANILNKDTHFLAGSMVGIELDGLINSCQDCKSTVQDIQRSLNNNISIQNFFLGNPGIASDLATMNISFSHLSLDIDRLIDEQEIQVYIPQISDNGSITYTPKAISGF